jgi:hypothetical protein
MLREFLIFHFIFYDGHQKRLIGRRSSLLHRNASRHVIDTWERSIFFSSITIHSLSPALPSLPYEPHQLYFPFISESYSTTGHFVAPRIAPNLKRSVVMIAARGLFTAQTVSAGYAYRITCHWQKGFVRNTKKYSCFSSLIFRVFFTKVHLKFWYGVFTPSPILYFIILVLSKI